MAIEDLILAAMRQREGYPGNYSIAAAVKNDYHYVTPIFRLPRGNTALPASIKSVIQQIYTSNGAVYDMAVPITAITCPLPGSIRSWYQNDGGWLPQVAFKAEELAGKALLYHNHVVLHKGLQNKQKKKGIAEVYTGYLEYTPCTTVDSQWARIVYDYVNDKVYFSPAHYTPFELAEEAEGFFPKIRAARVAEAWKHERPRNVENPFILCD